jgi:hypothetical protein
MVHDELGSVWIGPVMASFKLLSLHLPGGPEGNPDLIHGNLFPERDSNLRYLEYEAGIPWKSLFPIYPFHWN